MSHEKTRFGSKGCAETFRAFFGVTILSYLKNKEVAKIHSNLLSPVKKYSRRPALRNEVSKMALTGPVGALWFLNTCSLNFSIDSEISSIVINRQGKSIKPK